MKTIIVTSQAEWDALPKSFQEFTVIEIRSEHRITIYRNAENSSAELWGSSRAELWGSSRAVLRESSSAELWESSSAVLWESSSAVLRESSSAVLRGSSSAELWGSSRAVLWGSSRAVLWGSSRAVLWGSSRAVLWGSSRAVLWESSSAELWGSSSAELWESSSAELWGSSSAELWGSSSAVLWESSVAWNQSPDSTLLLWSYAVAYLFNKAKASRKAPTSTVITPQVSANITTDDWLTEHGVESEGNSVTLFKRVSKDLQTQEGTKNETDWTIGLALEHKGWNPKQDECGTGKFHAVPRAYLADQYRSADGDRYVAIEISKNDLFAWPKAPQHPHKIAFRKGKVLYECNRWGDKL